MELIIEVCVIALHLRYESSSTYKDVAFVAIHISRRNEKFSPEELDLL